MDSTQDYKLTAVQAALLQMIIVFEWAEAKEPNNNIFIHYAFEAARIAFQPPEWSVRGIFSSLFTGKAANGVFMPYQYDELKKMDEAGLIKMEKRVHQETDAETENLVHLKITKNKYNFEITQQGREALRYYLANHRSYEFKPF